jgi:nucleoside-diphosphate-sugar epimerase
MKVAVTGATGFIGRHVIRELKSRNVEIIAASRKINPLVDYTTDSVSYVTLDMDNEATCTFDQLGRPDVLLHLAWGGLPNYQSEAHVNHELPKQIAFLKSCIKSGLKYLVVTGTCLEYGMQSGMLSEELPAKPCTAYGRAKDQLRQYLQELISHNGSHFTWLRLFYLYGPGQASTSLYSQLRTAITEGRSEFAMSPGDQQRDFLPIETAASYICDLALLNKSLGLVNLCSGVPIKLTDLVQEWLHDWHAEIYLKLGVYPYLEYEPHAFWGSKLKLNAMIQDIHNHK